MSDGPAAPNVVAMKAVWLDTRRRFPIDPRRIYAGGFSGGARAAVLLALETQGDVAGVIACGGGFPDGSPPGKEMRFAFFGAVGNVDFNYGEMRRLDRTLATLGAAHRLAVFEGPHSWCPAPVCAEGVEWLELQAMKSGRRAKDSALVERLLRDRLERAAAAEAAGKTTEAFRRSSEAAEDFRGLAGTREAEGTSARLAQSGSVRKALAEQEEREETERGSVDRLWADLTVALLSDPPSPLKAVVNQLQVARLRREAGPERPEPARLSAARVLEQIFVQTAFYLPRDFARRHDFLRAELATGIAAELKPDRAGAVFYDLACFRALAGDRKGALASLRDAVGKGLPRRHGDGNGSRPRVTARGKGLPRDRRGSQGAPYELMSLPASRFKEGIKRPGRRFGSGFLREETSASVSRPGRNVPRPTREAPRPPRRAGPRAAGSSGARR
jgi:dienelactone hydrolase